MVDLEYLLETTNLGIVIFEQEKVARALKLALLGITETGDEVSEHDWRVIRDLAADVDVLASRICDLYENGGDENDGEQPSRRTTPGPGQGRGAVIPLRPS